MIRKAIIVLLALAALGAGVLWLDSHRQRPIILRRVRLYDTGDDNTTMVAVRGGTIRVARWGPDVSSLRSDDPIGTANTEVMLPYVFAFRSGAAAAGHSTSSFRLWLWVPFALFSTYPFIAFIRGPLRRWRRRRRGLCLKCGYDLTGNVTGICPECGASGERS